MRSSSLLLVAITLLTTQPVQASCVFCDDVIDINDVRAACFLEIYDKVLESFVTSGQSYLKVNFGVCEGLRADDDRGLDDPRDLPSAPSKFVYALDQERSSCLKSHLEAVEASLSPVTRLDLMEICPP
jgi:hypothetical protein